MKNSLLATELAALRCPGIGPKTLEKLAHLELFTVFDLLFHLPLRYEDRTKITQLKNLTIGNYAAIVAVITGTRIIYGRKPALIVSLEEAGHTAIIYFFNFLKLRLQHRLTVGKRIYCYGEIRSIGHQVGMLHPEFKLLQPDEAPPLTQSLTAIYPSTLGLTQKQLRNILTNILGKINDNNEQLELLPAEILNFFKLPPLIEALRLIHNPETLSNDFNPENPYRKRLAFEELLAEQLSLLKLEATLKKAKAPQIPWDSDFLTKTLRQLPFQLTTAQQRALNEIAADFTQPNPMLRLLQGDVGCGKTVIIAIALAMTVNAGYQAALMAPTELLAQQHFKTFSTWLSPLKITLILTTGSTSVKQRAINQALLSSGLPLIVIGTQAIFQKKIQFTNLALIAVDEQHRFGVSQRLSLRNKGKNDVGFWPHQLILSATPIPRTLAMTCYAYLSHSIIDELPHGRVKIHTSIMANVHRNAVMERLKANCLAGHQAYWVCPLINKVEDNEAKAAVAVFEELSKKLPQIKIGLIHGKMATEEKHLIMQSFLRRDIDLLVATTVIEVGVDVPNANLMIIENAEKLGIVQLHQLRGRVGRGTKASFCLLLYEPPLSQLAERRLKALRDFADGFKLAELDLKLRGAGEFLGIKQTGALHFRVADLTYDAELLPEVQRAARLIMNKYPTIISPLISRWIKYREEYGEIG